MKYLSKKEKTYLKYAAVIFLTSVCISTLIIFYTVMLDTSVTEEAIDAEAVRQVYETYPTQITTVNLGYYMKEYNGGLAIFREGGTSPYQILDFPVYLLSDEDKLAVETGIYVPDEKSMRRLIEDMCS